LELWAYHRPTGEKLYLGDTVRVGYTDEGLAYRCDKNHLVWATYSPDVAGDLLLHHFDLDTRATRIVAPDFSPADMQIYEDVLLASYTGYDLQHDIIFDTSSYNPAVEGIARTYLINDAIIVVSYGPPLRFYLSRIVRAAN
jgi:hypothetical protein